MRGCVCVQRTFYDEDGAAAVFPQGLLSPKLTVAALLLHSTGLLM
jgi:hypothetical protein